MADEIAPVVEQPVSQPEVAVLNDPAPVAAAPEPAPEPVVEQPKQEAEAPKPLTVAETPSLLEEAKAPGDDKPAAEAPKAEEEKPAAEAKAEEKPAEVKPEDKPAEGEQPKEEAAAAPEAPPPVEYKYELPENVTLPDERRAELHTTLDAFRADPSNLQPLIDFHVAEVNRRDEALLQQQHDVFNDTRKAWRDQIKADPEMGGSGFETTVRAVLRMRDMLVSSHPIGTPEYDRESKEFNEAARVTGFGDHPAIWRMLHNAARFLDEAQPLQTDIAPAPNGRAPGSKRGLLYNHPSSPNNKGAS